MEFYMNVCPWCLEETINQGLCDECQETRTKNEERNKKKFNNDSLRPKKDKKPWRTKQSRACPSNQ